MGVAGVGKGVGMVGVGNSVGVRDRANVAGGLVIDGVAENSEYLVAVTVGAGAVPASLWQPISKRIAINRR